VKGIETLHDEERTRRIRRIAERIERGEYRVPAQEVADSVIAWYRRIDPPTRR
jgi:anti-sigma28 factor (negative regulator of flagellin synthesis)